MSGKIATVTFRIPRRLKADLEAIAMDEGETLTSLLREALRDLIEKRMRKAASRKA